MFWRRRSNESGANHLRDEAQPNELSFDASEPNEFAAESDEELEGDDFEDDRADEEIEDATYEDEPVEADEADAAARAEALAAEVQRMAEEFGLADAQGASLYGPNGEEVALFLDQLPSLSDEELEEHFDAWDSVPRPERRIAALAAEEAERQADLSFEAESARRVVAAWMAECIREAEDTTGDADRFYEQMGRAVSEAVVALVLKAELDESDFEVLGGAWAEEIAGRPLPQPESAPDESEVPIEEGELGPNTDLVVALLDRLEALDDEEILALTAAWRKQPQGELRAAHRELQEVAREDDEWREQVRRAQDRVRLWVNREAQPQDQMAMRVRRPTQVIRPDAAPAVADAVAALVVADLIDPENAELLYDPWYSIVGEPELPLDDDDEDEDEDDRPE